MFTFTCLPVAFESAPNTLPVILSPVPLVKFDESSESAVPEVIPGRVSFPAVSNVEEAVPPNAAVFPVTRPAKIFVLVALIATKLSVKRLVEVAFVDVEKLEKRLNSVEDALMRPPENVSIVVVALFGKR